MKKENDDFMSKYPVAFYAAKMLKEVDTILWHFDKNEVLQKHLPKNSKFVIKRFLLKEKGCLKGIIEENIDEDIKAAIEENKKNPDIFNI